MGWRVLLGILALVLEPDLLALTERRAIQHLRIPHLERDHPAVPEHSLEGQGHQELAHLLSRAGAAAEAEAQVRAAMRQIPRASQVGLVGLVVVERVARGLCRATTVRMVEMPLQVLERGRALAEAEAEELAACLPTMVAAVAAVAAGWQVSLLETQATTETQAPLLETQPKTPSQ